MVAKTNDPYEITWVDRVVGLFVLGAVALVATVIVLRYQQIGPGPSTLPFHTRVDRSYGVARGADVRVSGIPIGQIDGVSLEPDGRVRIDFSIAERHRAFVTMGSRLQVGSSIGIGALIGGPGLNLLPDAGEALLPAGAYIETLQSVELAAAFSDVEIQKIAIHVKELLSNLHEISEVITDNQGVLAESMANVNEITLGLRTIVQRVPTTVSVVEEGFAAWRRAGEAVHAVVNDSGSDLRAVTAQTRQATARFDTSLAELETLLTHMNALVRQVEAGADRLPALLDDTHALVRGLTRLTGSLENHWLFSGRGAEQQRQMPLPSLHPLGVPPPTHPR